MVMTGPAKYPIISFCVCLVVLLTTCGLSLWKLNIDSDPFKLLTYSKSPAKIKRDEMNELFPKYKFMRAVSVIMTVNENVNQTMDIISKDSILYFHNIINQINELNSTTFDGKSIYFKDICLKMDSTGCMTLDIMAFWDFEKEKLIKDSNIHKTLSIPKRLSSGDLLNSESILGSIEWNTIKSTILKAKSFKYYAILLSDNENEITTWEKEFSKLMERKVEELTNLVNLNDFTTPRNVSLYYNSQYSLTEDITKTFVSVGPMFLISFSVTLIMVVTTLVLMRGDSSDSIILRIIIGCMSIILITMDIFSSFGIVHIIFGYNLNPLSAQALPLFLVGIGSDGLFILQTYFNRYRESLKELTSDENETLYEKFVKHSGRYYREVVAALIFTLIVMCCILMFVVLVMKHPIIMAISVAWQTMVSVIFLFFTAIFGITPLLILEFKFNSRKQNSFAPIPSSDSVNLENVEDNNLPEDEQVIENSIELETNEKDTEEESTMQTTQLDEMQVEEKPTPKEDYPKYRVDRIIFTIFEYAFDKPKYFITHILLILLAIGGIAGSIAIIASIGEEPFTMTDLYAKSSQLTSFLHHFNTHYGDLEYPGYLVMYNKENSSITDKIDFASPAMANLLEQVFESPPKFMKAQINWFSYFKTWIFFMSSHSEEFRANRFKVPPQKFNSWIEEFTNHKLFSNLADFVISKQDSMNMTAARVVFSNKNFLNSEVTAVIEKENMAFMKKLALDYPETGLNPSKNLFIVNDMDLIFESFTSDPFNVSIICALAIISVAIVSVLVTSIFEIPIMVNGKLSLFINIVICSIITCFLTLMTLIELVAGLRVLGIPINGLSIMNFTLQIGLFSEYLFQITKAFILTRSVKKAYTLLTIPLLVCSLSTFVSILPLAFHDIRIVKKYFFDIIILGQAILLFNTLIIFPAILSLIEKVSNCLSLRKKGK